MSKLIKNSFWGIIANVLQNIFYSIFFVLVARKYSSQDFSNYILANTIYGFVLAFSSLGLGQWFIRELNFSKDKISLINTFFKVQILIGLLFYLLNVIISFLLYDNLVLRELSLLIGINVIFDNIIYVIKNINIAESQQQKTFIIITIEAFVKLLIGCVLFMTNIPIVELAFFLIILRFLTLNLFLNLGLSYSLNIRSLFFARINYSDFREIIYSNWPFIIIGSISVVYWKMGNILISKFLPLHDVAEYEISFKLFSLAETIPIIISSTVFSLLVEKVKVSKWEAKRVFKLLFLIYAMYGLLAFTFIVAYSGYFIPVLFGKNYANVSNHTIEMFLTMILFPTALLQANLIIALRLEKMDMWFNVVSLIVNLLVSFIGLQFIKSLSVINYAIFISFFVFHIMQDIYLLKSGYVSMKDILGYYLLTGCLILVYYALSHIMPVYMGFIIFWIAISIVVLIVHFKGFSLSNLRIKTR